MLGARIGETIRPFPGLTPVSKRLHDCLADVGSLEASKYELDSIRATLLLNFGATEHNHYNFTITDEGSTSKLLMDVLTRIVASAPYGSTEEKK